MSNIQKYISLIFLLCLIKSEHKIISIPYREADNKLTTFLYLGYPSQDINVTLNQENDFTYFSFPDYDIKQSMTYGKKGEERVSLNGYNIQASIVTEMIEFDCSMTMFFIDLYVYHFQNNPNKENSHYSNSLSLSYNVKHSNYSLVNQIKHEKFIDKLSYGFHDTTKKLYFGGFPERFLIDKYEAKCKVNDKFNKYKLWGCLLKNVYIGNSEREKYIITNEYAYLTINERRIFTPEEFLVFLSNTIFKEYIERGQCKYKNSMSYKYFYCDCRYIDDFPNIIFDFNDYHFELNRSELFEEAKDNRCNFNIASNSENQIEKVWSFGRLFILKYHTLFDYDNNEIRFYSETPFGKHNTKKYRTIQSNTKSNIITIICSFVLISGIIVLLLSLLSHK